LLKKIKAVILKKATKVESQVIRKKYSPMDRLSHPESHSKTGRKSMLTKDRANKKIKVVEEIFRSPKNKANRVDKEEMDLIPIITPEEHEILSEVPKTK
jgi:hypothetical protein